MILPARKSASRRRTERGYILITLILFVALLAIAAVVMAPVIAFPGETRSRRGTDSSRGPILAGDETFRQEIRPLSNPHRGTGKHQPGPIPAQTLQRSHHRKRLQDSSHRRCTDVVRSRAGRSCSSRRPESWPESWSESWRSWRSGNWWPRRANRTPQWRHEYGGHGWRSGVRHKFEQPGPGLRGKHIRNPKSGTELTGRT